MTPGFLATQNRRVRAQQAERGQNILPCGGKTNGISPTHRSSTRYEVGQLKFIDAGKLNH